MIMARHNAKDDKEAQRKVREDEERINRLNREEKDANERLRKAIEKKD